MLRAIVFDFDGVILESVNIKTQAFRVLFSHYPMHQEKIVELHLENAELSRYKKFEIIYRDFLKIPLSEEEMVRLGKAYSRLVYREILKCPFVPGAFEFLQARVSQYRLFIASGTPQDELLDIIGKRELAPFFIGVFGSPQSKSEILQTILKENDLRPENLIFIGDAQGDYLSARENSVPFIWRMSDSAPISFSTDDVPATVTDLRQLDRDWSYLLNRNFVEVTAKIDYGPRKRDS